MKKNVKKLLSWIMLCAVSTSPLAGQSFVYADDSVQGKVTKSSISGVNVYEMNSEVNNAAMVTEDDAEVLELGAPTTEEGAQVVGVEVDNPFADNEDLYESWEEAFANYGVTFNGLTYDNSLRANKKTVAGYGKYFGGLNARNGRIQIVDANFDTNVATFSTKEKAQMAFEEARRFLFNGGGTGKGWLGSSGEAASWIQEIEADESGLIYVDEDLKEYLYKLRAVTGEALVNEEAIPAELVSYIYWGPVRGCGALPEPNTIEGEFSYPLPKWTKGVSISTWVKVPEDATGTAPIFTFAKSIDTAMTLRTDGTFVFVADDSGTRAGKDNQYAATFTGSTPYDNKGEWVYVTLTVKNDEVNVYYNGEKAVETLGKNSKAGKGRNFNGGFGKKAWGTDEQRTEAILNAEFDSYVNLLRNFDEDENPDYSDFSKYNYGNGTLMIDFLANYNTYLFIGGYEADTIKSYQIYDGTGGWYGAENEDGTGRISPNKDKGWGAYNGYCESMRIGAMDFQDYPVTAEEAAGMYEKALATDRSFKQTEENTPTPTPSPTQTPSPTPTPTPIPEPWMWEDFSQIVSEDGFSMLELRNSTGIELGIGCIGREIENPFADNEELYETWEEAFANYGVTFNGLTYDNSLKENKKTVAMYGKYFNGLQINSKNRVNFSDKNTTVFITKEKAQQAFEEARNYLVDNNYLGANGVAAQIIAQVEADESGLEYQNDVLKEYLHKLAAVTGEAITNAEAVPAELVSYIYWGPARGCGALPEPNTIEGEFNYPLPKWTKGVSISTWVKVPEDATGTAPIFAFVKDRDNALTLRTDGTFMFGTSDGNRTGTNAGRDNQYCATFEGHTPYANKGEWVYVTLTVKNDEVHVYYNGENATSEKLGRNSAKGKAKSFNGGFGKKAWGTDEERIEAIFREEWNSYEGLLKNFGLEENPDYSDFSKYYHENGTLMLDFLADWNTYLYIGGAEKATLYSGQMTDGDKQNAYIVCGPNIGWAGYSEQCKGMRIGAMDFQDYPVTAEEAAGMYERALVTDRSFNQIEGDTPTPSPEPTTTSSPEPTITSSPEPTASSKPAVGIETTTEQIVNEDGSITEKVTEKEIKEDGTIREKVTETTVKKDGTKVTKEREIVTQQDGSTVTTIKETTIFVNKDETADSDEKVTCEDLMKLLATILNKLIQITDNILERITTTEKKQVDGTTVVKNVEERIKVDENGEVVKETVVLDEKKDETGRSVEKYEYSTKALPDDVEWKTEIIEEVQEEEKQAIEDMGATDYVIYNITPESNGSKVDVNNDKVKVSLFGGNKWKGKNIKVFDFKENRWLDAIVDGDYVSFYAQHFSKYAIAEVADVKKGDADLNGNITLEDARMVLRVALGLSKLEGDGCMAADVDGDGKITLKDAKKILRFALGLEVLV